jgi:hypothetical protein
MNVVAAVAAFFAFVCATSANARPVYDDAWNPFVQQSSAVSDAGRSVSKKVKRQRYAASTRAARVARAQPESYSGRHSAGPRPRAWCGWWMRTQRGGGPHLNVAWNWSKWGRPAGGPQVGAVVVWRHHVGEIVGRAENGKWLVRSGNDSNAVRTRARSVAGAVFRVG